MIQKIRQDKNIGSNFKELRIKSGLSQEKLCVKLQIRGCDLIRSTYAKYESGILNVRVSVLNELKLIYHCEYDDFFKGV